MANVVRALSLMAGATTLLTATLVFDQSQQGTILSGLLAIVGCLTLVVGILGTRMAPQIGLLFCVLSLTMIMGSGVVTWVNARGVGDRPKGDAIGIWQNDPELGWTNKPGSTGQHVQEDFDVTYTIDATGRRVTAEPVPTDGQKPEVVVMLGASCTFGHGVSDDQCYPAVLARKWWKTLRVENHAVSGWGTGQCYLQLKRRLRTGEPVRLVLYGWIPDHASRNHLRKAWLQEIDRYGRRNVYFESSGSGVVYKGLVGPESGVDNSADLVNAESRNTVALIRAMSSLCDLENVPFVVVILPRRDVPPQINNWLTAACKDQGIPFIDVTDASDAYFKIDHHPTAIWHEAIAERIAGHSLIGQLLP